MATNLSKITKLKAGKGEPPKAESSPDVVRTNTRTTGGETVPLQFRVSPAEFEEFSAMAVKEFGHKHGAKTAMFRRLLESYTEKS